MSQSLADAVARFAPGLPLWVAFSGGADSTALLLACADKWPGQVRAIHIHHGLQAAADEFERHCVAFCAAHNIPLVTQRVNAANSPGQSPEDAARRARYRAFSALALVEYAQQAIKIVAKPQAMHLAIAQHADDQVETILLALSRGAGLAGLSGMPATWERDGIQYHRPLLGVSAADIRTWLADRGITADMPPGQGFIEDPTNADEQFTRNRIRARLLPALEAAFPHFRDTFARSAAHAAQAQELLTDVAWQDMLGLVQPGNSAPVIDKVRQLSRARQANALRHWLKTAHETVPSAAQLDELLDQIAACSTRGHHIHIKVGAGFVQRKGAVLDWYNP
ncbi:MAG TPA: tRNA lysidine(34) synthetase TilS [Burkholderiaceae bacterium]|nr:tRNA lysidine(34) synthetase TilS [Burkholderiaceae bacterium]